MWYVNFISMKLFFKNYFVNQTKYDFGPEWATSVLESEAPLRSVKWQTTSLLPSMLRIISA